jgi:hypothetical protein
MDQDTIKQIATEIVARLPNYAWVLIVIQTDLILLAAAGGAFFGEYLKTRGKNLATKADFDDLKKQLRDNTKLVETIKSDVSQRDWARREWINLRRSKLEELLNLAHDCSAYLKRQHLGALDGKVFEEADPLGKVETIATLYFPEVANETYTFGLVCRERGSANLTLAHEVIGAKAANDPDAMQAAIDKYKVQMTPAVARADRELKQAARKLLVEILNLE